MQLASPGEIRRAYQSSETAAGYVADRFASELNRLLHDRQVATINALIEKLRPRRTLEIAAGPGRLSRDVRPHGQLVCLDYNEGMIRQGRPFCDARTRWVRADGFRLPFSTCFDLIYSFRFVRHFRHADRARVFAEIRRLLTPGGHFVMDAVNERVSGPLRREHPEQYPIFDQCYHFEEVRSELIAAGLEPVAIVPVQKFYRHQYRSQVLLGPRANWANRWVIRGLERLPSRDGLEWIVTCRRA